MVWCWQASWKKFLIDMMYLRGHVTLYPNFPNQTSFSTNHMEPGVHIAAADNVVTHHKEDYEVPLLQVYFPLLYPISYKLNSNFCLLEKAFLHIQFGVTVVWFLCVVRCINCENYQNEHAFANLWQWQLQWYRDLGFVGHGCCRRISWGYYLVGGYLQHQNSQCWTCSTSQLPWEVSSLQVQSLHKMWLLATKPQSSMLMMSLVIP